jgi:AAA ATPase domain
MAGAATKLRIKSVRLRDFRSFEDAEIRLDGTTILVGPNNVGKTNILDAISLLGREKSFDLATDLRRHSQVESPQLTFLLSTEVPVTMPAYDYTLPTDISITKTAQAWNVTAVDGSDFAPRSNGAHYFRNGTAAEVTVGGWRLPVNGLVAASVLKGPMPEDSPLTEMPESEAIGRIRTEAQTLITAAIPKVAEKWRAAESDFIEDTAIAQILSDTQKAFPISILLARAAANDPGIGNYEAVLRKNLPSEVHSLLERLSASANELFRKNWRFRPAIRITLTQFAETIKVYFNQGTSGVIEPKFTSDGLRWLVSFFIRLGMSEVRDTVLLLDQPGDLLYPGGQKDLVRLIEQLGDRNQVVYTTHSPFMISKSRLGRNVRIISKPTDANENQTGYSTVTNEIRETDIRQSELLTDALGFYWTDFVPVGDFNVLMEGKLDAAVILGVERQKAVKQGVTEIDLNRVVIRGVHGASNIEAEAKTLKGDGRRVLCVYDGDWKHSTPSLSGPEKIQLSDVNPAWQDIEDLLPADWISETLGEMSKGIGATLTHDPTTMVGPGLGSKLKQYFSDQGKELSQPGLKDKWELQVIDRIQAFVTDGTELPASFYSLSKAIEARVV